MNTHRIRRPLSANYSRYAGVPVDRDHARMAQELSAMAADDTISRPAEPRDARRGALRFEVVLRAHLTRAITIRVRAVEPSCNA